MSGFNICYLLLLSMLSVFKVARSHIYSHVPCVHCKEILKIAGKLSYILRWVNAIVFCECQAVKQLFW